MLSCDPRQVLRRQIVQSRLASELMDVEFLQFSKRKVRIGQSLCKQLTVAFELIAAKE